MLESRSWKRWEEIMRVEMRLFFLWEWRGIERATFSKLQLIDAFYIKHIHVTLFYFFLCCSTKNILKLKRWVTCIESHVKHEGTQEETKRRWLKGKNSLILCSSSPPPSFPFFFSQPAFFAWKESLITHCVLFPCNVFDETHLLQPTGLGPYLKVSRFEASNSLVRDTICSPLIYIPLFLSLSLSLSHFIFPLSLCFSTNSPFVHPSPRTGENRNREKEKERTLFSFHHLFSSGCFWKPSQEEWKETVSIHKWQNGWLGTF